MSGRELDFIKPALAEDWAVPMGPDVNAFERELAAHINAQCTMHNAQSSDNSQFSILNSQLEKRLVALESGTSAIHLALILCGVKPGDEVIVQSMTFCASTNPVAYLGATPVFVDSEPYTWNMDPDLLREAIEDRIAKTGRKPKAIIPVALYGMPYQIDRILEIADSYGIPVIEDAAEGFCSRFNGRVLGTFGRFGILSFNGNKMITTSGGGALICPDRETADKAKWYATQARESYPYYQHEAVGYNYRLSNISACIGRAQLTVLDEHLAHHRHVQALYEELLKDVKGIKMHRNPTPPQPSPQGEGAVLRKDLPVSGNYNILKEYAKRMRKNPTKEEEIMWEMLRKKNLNAKFRRQQIIGDFIVDFVDFKSGIVIEIDGGYHNQPDQLVADSQRSEFLNSYGYKVIRFTNDQVLFDLDNVLEKISLEISTASNLPLPAEGVGGRFDSNFWLCTATLDEYLKVRGQEEAYKSVVNGAVGGAAGVTHAASSATTDCQPNDNVEALRLCLDKANIEARPLWKPMHRQPVFKDCPAYVNGVSESLFKTGICLPAGPYVTDDDVRYITDTIKASIIP